MAASSPCALLLAPSSHLLASSPSPSLSFLPLSNHSPAHLLRSSPPPFPRHLRQFSIVSSLSNHDDEAHLHSQAPLLDRRELIIQAASLASSLSLLSPPLALAAPVVPPDLNTCDLAIVNSNAGNAPTSELLCCIPTPKRPIIDFRFEKNPPIRRRRPAHLVDEKYIAKYNKAYELMKALPLDDPRNFRRQADVHCSFCNGAYTQPGTTSKLQVHFSWLFLPWHRWYLYYHERILADLIGDPTFALPFWNWDNQEAGNVMPAMYTKEGTALYDSKRTQAHLPPALAALNLSSIFGATTKTNSQIIQENLNVMYQSIVTASTAQLFMGGAYRAGASGDATGSIDVGGTLEMAPHTAIHAWTGDTRETYLEDMGNFYSAARDPIFFAHHSNVDRLWSVWNNIGGRRTDYTDPDFLNAEFVFYDEKADLVRVKVGDALNSAKLGVYYEPVKADRLWLNYSPQPISTGAPSDAAKVGEIGPAAQNTSSTNVGKKLASQAPRPSGPPQELLAKGLKADEVEEVLVLEGVVVPKDTVTHLAVFINLPDADDETPLNCAEYVGSFYNIPHFGPAMDMNMRTTNVRFGISDNIKRLGITDLSKLVVTVVSKIEGTGAPITIQGIKIEFE